MDKSERKTGFCSLGLIYFRCMLSDFGAFSDIQNPKFDIERPLSIKPFFAEKNLLSSILKAGFFIFYQINTNFGQ